MKVKLITVDFSNQCAVLLPMCPQARLHARKLHCAATLIQATWRGWYVRHKSNGKVQQACVRVEKANHAAKQSQSLRNRLPHILDLLLRSKYLSTAADILETLGVLPRPTRPYSRFLHRGKFLWRKFSKKNKEFMKVFSHKGSPPYNTHNIYTYSHTGIYIHTYIYTIFLPRAVDVCCGYKN